MRRAAFRHGWGWPGDGNANDIQDGNNGTLGNASFATGEVEQGFRFGYNEQGVVIPHNNTLNVNSPGFTADFWMQGIKNQPGSIAAVFEKSHGFVDNTGWAFQVETALWAFWQSTLAMAVAFLGNERSGCFRRQLPPCRRDLGR